MLKGQLNSILWYSTNAMLKGQLNEILWFSINAQLKGQLNSILWYSTNAMLKGQLNEILWPGGFWSIKYHACINISKFVSLCTWIPCEKFHLAHAEHAWISFCAWQLMFVWNKIPHILWNFTLCMECMKLNSTHRFSAQKIHAQKAFANYEILSLRVEFDSAMWYNVGRHACAEHSFHKGGKSSILKQIPESLNVNKT